MLKVRTHLLQSMVLKASKGASNNKMLPITGMMGIKVVTEDDKSLLSLCTTDATNYLFISEPIDLTDDMEVVIPEEQFSKLVSKITTDTIGLELTKDKLVVTGNGTYGIELPLDELGNPVKFPNPLEKLTLTNSRTISLGSIKSILLHNKPSLAIERDVPCYTGYYMDASGVITTDTYTMCGNEIKLFEEPVLLSREMVDLLDIFTTDKIEVMEFGNNLVFASPGCIVYGAKMNGIEDYQVEALKGLLEQDFPCMVKVSRNRLINSLDRLNLFVGRYDKNKIKLDFTKDALVISSKANSGTETIEYNDKVNASEFYCYIDVEMFSTELKAQECDIVELWYGLPNAIKAVDGDVTQVIALDEDD